MERLERVTYFRPRIATDADIDERIIDEISYLKLENYLLKHELGKCKHGTKRARRETIR